MFTKDQTSIYFVNEDEAFIIELQDNKVRLDIGYDSVALTPNKEIMIQYDNVTDKIILKEYRTLQIL